MDETEKVEIRIIEDATGECVNTIETSRGKFDRVLAGLMRRVDLDRFTVDYPEDV